MARAQIPPQGVVFSQETAEQLNNGFIGVYMFNWDSTLFNVLSDIKIVPNIGVALEKLRNTADFTKVQYYLLKKIETSQIQVKTPHWSWKCNILMENKIVNSGFFFFFKLTITSFGTWGLLSCFQKKKKKKAMW